MEGAAFWASILYLLVRMPCTWPQPLSAIALATASAAVLEIELQQTAASQQALFFCQLTQSWQHELQ